MTKWALFAAAPTALFQYLPVPRHLLRPGRVNPFFECVLQLPGIQRLMAVFKFTEFASIGLIVTIVSPAFGRLAADDQLKRMARLQICAEAAGLRGTVVPVWKNDDTYEFLTPREFAEFLTHLKWTEILGRIQGKFTCD